MLSRGRRSLAGAEDLLDILDLVEPPGVLGVPLPAWAGGGGYSGGGGPGAGGQATTVE
jgi:hypothetical protein